MLSRVGHRGRADFLTWVERKGFAVANLGDGPHWA